MSVKKQKGSNVLWVHRAILIMFVDALSVLISYFLALLLRFDFVFSRIPVNYLEGYLWSMPYWILSTIVIFYICRLYHSIWRLASVAELRMIITAYLIIMVVDVAGMLFMHLRMPRSYYFMGYVLCFCMTAGTRFSYRLLRSYTNRKRQEEGKEEQDRIMIIGGGEAGQVLIKELINSSRFHTKVCCVIDDNPNKRGRVLEGIPIVGDRNDILEMVEKYEVNHIIYAIPTSSAKTRKEILNICKDTKCRLQTVPGVYQLLNGEVSVSTLKNVEIQDLLGREQIKVNNEEILNAIGGKIVLVTGGGRLDRQRVVPADSNL